MSKRILVTGGAGFIGSQITNELLRLGHEVAVVDNLSSGYLDNTNKAAKFYKMDLADRNLSRVFEEEKPEIIFHCAAQISVSNSVKSPINDANINVISTLNMLENAKRYKSKKIIFSSTGGAIYGEPQYLPCDEDHKINPMSPYGLSKYVAEQYVKLYHRLYGLNYIIFRYSNVYGPYQNPNSEAGVIAIFCRMMLDNSKISIFGSGNQERDFIYISDVVAANLLALDTGKNGVYNVGSSEGTTINKIFILLSEIFKYNAEPSRQPPRDGDIEKIHLSNSRIKTELGWDHRVPLEQGIRMTTEYYSNLRDG